jgi:hypothetical protein
VVAMYKLTSVGDRNSTFDAVGILVVFTLLFSAAMSLLTKAKRHELFAASAAYCAVLVVFISNFSNNSVGKLQQAWELTLRIARSRIKLGNWLCTFLLGVRHFGDIYFEWWAIVIDNLIDTEFP